MGKTIDYKGSTYQVSTVEKKFGRRFYLYVDGEAILSATELEKKGFEFEDVDNWTQTLYTFAEGYIDGNKTMDAGFGRVYLKYVS